MTLEDVLVLRKLFPDTIFNDGKPIYQLQHVLNEYKEAMTEYEAGNKHDALIETIDVIHTAVNVLYKANYTNAEISKAIEEVIVKNDKRGYYK